MRALLSLWLVTCVIGWGIGGSVAYAGCGTCGVDETDAKAHAEHHAEAHGEAHAADVDEAAAAVSSEADDITGEAVEGAWGEEDVEGIDASLEGHGDGHPEGGHHH